MNHLPYRSVVSGKVKGLDQNTGSSETRDHAAIAITRCENERDIAFGESLRHGIAALCAER